MSFFTTEQAAALAATTVRPGWLVEFAFTTADSPPGDAPIRLWNGDATLVTLDDKEWKGVGALGAIDGLQETRDAESQQLILSLSGVDTEALAAAIGEQEAVQGKDVNVYMQLFDAAWRCVGNPVNIRSYVCQNIAISFSEAEGDQGSSRSIAIQAENVYAGRSRPAAGRYTDRDQQTRFPGDRGLEFIPQLANLVYVWPNY